MRSVLTLSCPDESHRVPERANSLRRYGELRDRVERYATPGPGGD